VLLTWALIRYLEQVGDADASGHSLSETWQQMAAQVAIQVLENKRLNQNPKAPGRVLKSLALWRARRRAAKGDAAWERMLEEMVHDLVTEEKLCPPTEPTAQRRWLKALAQQIKKRLPHARGDVCARIGRVGGVRLVCGYWLGFLVDSLQSVVTAVRVVPLNVDQRSQMTPAVEQHYMRTSVYPKAISADSAQDFHPVHQALDNHHIQGHIASRAYQPGHAGLGFERYTWNEQGDLCCPAGEVMTAEKLYEDGRIRFIGSACAACPLRQDCLPKKQQPHGPRRLILRTAAHQRWQQNRAHTFTSQYKAAQSKRFASEGQFGLAKRLHGAAKMPYRSLAMNHIAGLMIAIVMDLSLLARRGERVPTNL
jgi:hypothetical protein